MTPVALAIPAPIPFPLELTLSWAPLAILATLLVLDWLALRVLRAAALSFRTSSGHTVRPQRLRGVPQGVAGSKRRTLRHWLPEPSLSERA